MVESLPTMVDTHIKEQVKKAFLSRSTIHTISFHKNDPQLISKKIIAQYGIALSYEVARIFSVKAGEESPEYELYVSESHRLDKSIKRNEMMKYDVSLDSVTRLMEEVSLTIDEAKLKKMADEMLRQRCTSGYEHQYHIDQMKNFLKSDIVWENLLYLKKERPGPEKIVLSLHKFPAIIFNDDDIEERYSDGFSDMEKELMRFHLELKVLSQKLNSYASISFQEFEKHQNVSIIYEPCMKSYTRITRRERGDEVIQRFIKLTDDEVEYLKLFEEEIEVRLKYRNQMRRWEMYVNGRPLGLRERPRIIDP
ncbi:hypothetical protein Tco_1077453 [Tanacetum coccineum]